MKINTHIEHKVSRNYVVTTRKNKNDVGLMTTKIKSPISKCARVDVYS